MFRDFVEPGYKRRALFLDEAERLHVDLAIAQGEIPRPEMLVPAGGAWKFWDVGIQPAEGWSAPGFDDSRWREGRAQFGYGDGDETTVTGFGDETDNKHLTTWFRRRFVPPATREGTLRLSLLCDDGAVVYVNGQEVVREGMAPGLVTATTAASVTVQGHAEDIFRIHTVDLAAVPLRDGENIIAVEVHQNEALSSDLSFDLEVLVNFVTPDPVAGRRPGRFRDLLGDAAPDVLLRTLSEERP
jgi:hypothetical protein